MSLVYNWHAAGNAGRVTQHECNTPGIATRASSPSDGVCILLSRIDDAKILTIELDAEEESRLYFALLHRKQMRDAVRPQKP